VEGMRKITQNFCQDIHLQEILALLRKINKVTGLMPHKNQMRGVQAHIIYVNRSLHCKHHTTNSILDFILQIFCCPDQILINSIKTSNFYFKYTKQK
jgi:hypothetical protein